MPLVSSSLLLQAARRHHFAIPAFNVHNMEMIQAAVVAAAEAQSPVIIQTTVGTVEFAGPETLVAITKAASNEHDIPVILHLDHGPNIDVVRACLEAGYTSVMADGSHLPYEENVQFVNEVVHYARLFGANVEAEIGEIGGVEDDIEKSASTLTPVELAKRFVEDTTIDCVAPSVGSLHGIYTSKVQLDFDRIAQISEATKTPVALHGGSGIPVEDVQKAVSKGICKLNVGTELKGVFANALRQGLESSEDPRKYMKYGREKLAEFLKSKFTATNAVGSLNLL